MTVQVFEEKILRGALNMISPDVMVDDGKGTVLISSDEDETTDNLSKFLSVSIIVLLRCIWIKYNFTIFLFCRTLKYAMVLVSAAKTFIKNII